MSIETIRQYIARLPAQPGPDRVLHRIGADRVAGSLGAVQVTSVFQPIVDRDGTLFGHQALLRAVGPRARPVAPLQVLGGLKLDAIVRFDRMCRTVHALNRFAATPEWSPLFLGVDCRLLQYVPEEHGATFQRILAGFGVLASRVVITLPSEAVAEQGLLENVLPSYRLRNFGIAVDATGWPTAASARIARLRPDYVRVRWDANASYWASVAHDAGARLVATHVELPEDHGAALHGGADLLQGFQIGRPTEAPAAAEVADG